jgi:hypothetical protein
VTDSAPAVTAKRVQKSASRRRPVAREYLCGYPLTEWINERIASHDPSLQEEEVNDFHHKLLHRAVREVYPAGGFFWVRRENSHKQFMIIAVASNWPWHLATVPRPERLKGAATNLGYG